jgi:hypothetical protein
VGGEIEKNNVRDRGKDCACVRGREWDSNTCDDEVRSTTGGSMLGHYPPDNKWAVLIKNCMCCAVCCVELHLNLNPPESILSSHLLRPLLLHH